MKVEAFDHIHIYSKEPEKTVLFYKKHFDCKELYAKEGIGGVKAFLSLGGQIIVIGSLPLDRDSATDLGENAHRHELGLDHFGIRVKNLDIAIQELREQGVEILAEPVKGSSGVSYAFIAAPDGVIIELTQYGVLPKMFLKYKNRKA